MAAFRRSHAPLQELRGHLAGPAAPLSKLRRHFAGPCAAPTTEPVLHIVLFEPQIPTNTGTIGRLALAARCRLHLVGPLGFSIDDKQVRRAGLDYWPLVDCVQHASWEEYACSTSPERMWLVTTGGTRTHWEATYKRGDHLLFGNESSGAPEWMHNWIREQGGGDGQRVRIPMGPEVSGRSLNLACAVSCTVYEGLRQISDAEGALPF